MGRPDKKGSATLFAQYVWFGGAAVGVAPKQKENSNMKVLIACEFSGIVRDAFSNKGHDAWSCDLLPTESQQTFDEGKHIIGDVLDVIDDGWDLMIAHPPCTYLANSGVQHLWIGRKKINGKNVSRWAQLDAARQFFIHLLNAPIEKIAIENPVPHGYAELPKYSQIIQPFEHGHEAQKKTCIWLKGLQLLEPTKIVGKGEQYIGKNGKPNGSKWYQLSPSQDKWKHRSKTFKGIAEAMAEQWG